ncbi:metalloregulator ArsR/SmtB family transcription factor [Sinomonas notoginsengisoli]|uniref:ArsR/SmtB family transcription factor n=1 Tax=Sinomonas notoginsengisoli TaxID=1457311 RepID=UPI001F465D81|nr:metalloregulator ArsR/SmtB family transcription factor [Sinomonas notoginsengisoli]
MFSDSSAPLYEIKANLFKGLAHPARVRILEILAESPDQSCPVSELLEGTGLEASHLSQHLATLRRHRVVTSVRSANTVTYSLANPKIAELLAIARTFLLDTLTDTRKQLEAASALPPAGAAASAHASAHDGAAR